MKPWVRFGLKAGLVIVVALAVLGAAVMLLWNALVPELFGWRAVDYPQALGMLVLCRILFGAWRGGHGGHLHWRARMLERWETMSEEEREQFRAALRRRCGRPEPSAPSKA